jgi:hypothetical protein
MIEEPIIQLRSGPLPEVPWVMGDPSSSYKWQVSVAQGKRGKGHRRTKSKKMEGVFVEIFLKGKYKDISLGFLKKGVEEDFDLMLVAIAILRAIHFAKLKHIDTIVGDSKTIYISRKRSFSEVIGIMENLDNKKYNYKSIEIEALLKPNCPIKVDIKKVHKRGKPPITISLKGKIQKENFDRLIGYINKHLEVKKIQY